MTEINGFFNINKPTGMTSFEVIKQLKKKLGISKIGHLGTLDPSASGVLPIAIGKYTKFFDYFLQKDKEYFAVVKFGIETDTLDSFGKVLKTDSKIVKRNDLEQTLKSFIGKIDQVPPKYSAVKVNGKKACDLSREQIDFDLKPKQIEIYGIDLIDEIKDQFLFKVNCSSGTYIRQLFSDIAKNFNTVSTTTAIIRTKSGIFDIEHSKLIDETRIDDVIFAENVMNKEIISVDNELAKKLINGVKISSELLNLKSKNNEFFIKYQDKIIGLYKLENGKTNCLIYLY